MEPVKLKVWPFALLSVVLSILICLTAWGLALWQWGDWPATAIAAGVSLLLGGLIGWLFWLVGKRRVASRPSEEQQKTQQRLLAGKRLLNRTFDRVWHTRCQGDSNPYKTPWYLFLSENLDRDRLLLQQMGFEAVVLEDVSDDVKEPITFWVSDFAVLIGIDTVGSITSVKDALLLCLKRLKSKRPRQAANGLLVGVQVSRLLRRSQDELERFSKQQRQLLRDINTTLGVRLPTYSVLTEMAELKDFCQAFSTVEEHRLEETFGALMPVQAQRGYDPQWFLSSFEDLQRKLATQTAPALKAQLNAEYRDSILLGPYQFGLLQAELEAYFGWLYTDNQFEESPLNFRGYFFTNAAAESSPTDRLTMVLASQLGFASTVAPAPASVGRSLFAKQLMRRDILAESGLVGVNRKRESLYNLFRLTFSGGLIVLFGLFLWLLKANFDYYQTLDNRAVQQLDTYKQNLLANKPNADDLAAPIYSLSELRDISQIYKQPEPWYVLSWLPNPGINEKVQLAYQEQLEDVLLITMRDYLLKDLYVYNKLEDTVKTLELFNLHQVLYSKKREHPDALVDYYVRSLQAEGEGDVATLERFRELLGDLLATGAVPPMDSEPLIELVKASLSAENLSDLLYQHVLAQPELAKRVDMRGRLGQSYQTALSFTEGFGGYLIPYAFTREGFQDLMNSTRFELATIAIKDYEGVVGRISGKAELSRLNRKLRQRYIEDYIGYWQRFVANVHWVPTAGWADTQQQLTLVSDPIFSPLKRYYTLLNYHTDLTQVVQPAEEVDGKAKKVKVKGKLGGVAKKAQGPAQAKQAEREQQRREEQMQSAMQMVADIAQPFGSYKKMMTPDDAGQSRFDLATRQMVQTLAWLKQAETSQSHGQYFLDQLAEVALVNPLAQMSDLADSYSESVLRDLLQGSAERLNQLALSDVRTLLNSDWNDSVVTYYSEQLDRLYPFDTAAEQDVSLKSFKGFFGPKGAMAGFVDKYVVYFNARDKGNPVLNSFLPGQFLALEEGFWSALERVSLIRSTFFTADKLGVKFALRAQELSGAVTEFSLRSDRSIYVYRNGPSLWKSVNWPAGETQSRNLEMRVKGSEKTYVREEFPGIWSWFRMADALNGALVNEGVTSALEANGDDQSAKLLLRVDGETNPFVAGFFTSLVLPETL